MKRNDKTKRGFTLIELLVVIAIIGILSSVVLASLNTARYKANDAKRRSDLISLRDALELYYTKHGEYPSTGGLWSAVSAPAQIITSDWIPGLVADGDISQLPQDPAFPQSPGIDGCSNHISQYYYHSISGTGYHVVADCPSNSSVVNTPTSDGLYDPVRQTFAWKVCSGAECND